MVRLDDLEGLFQSLLFCDSVVEKGQDSQAAVASHKPMLSGLDLLVILYVPCHPIEDHLPHGPLQHQGHTGKPVGSLLFQAPCCGQGCLSLRQIAYSSIQTDPENLQSKKIPSISGQSLPVSLHSHSKTPSSLYSI